MDQKKSFGDKQRYLAGKAQMKVFCKVKNKFSK